MLASLFRSSGHFFYTHYGHRFLCRCGLLLFKKLVSRLCDSIRAAGQISQKLRNKTFHCLLSSQISCVPQNYSTGCLLRYHCQFATHRFKDKGSMRQNGWKCTGLMRNVSEKNKGTPGERMSVCLGGCIGGWGWGAEMHEWRGLRESWREANGGQTEREELACDGSCPGLILSVCAGWQEGCKGRLDPSSHTHTHTQRWVWFGQEADR